MKNNRHLWLDLLGPVEGGVAKRSKEADPGGITNRGITLPALASWRKNPNVTVEDLLNIDQDEADAIASADYWNAAKCDDLFGGLDICVADFSFHSSVRQAVITLQRLIGLEGKEVDGHVGPITLKAISKQQPDQLIKDYIAARLAFMKRLKNWEHNKNGWPNRLAKIERLALSLCPKRSPSAAVKVQNTVTAVVAAVGVSAPVVVATLPYAKDTYQNTADALAPLAQIHPAIPVIAASIAALAVLYLAIRGIKRAT